MAAKKPPAPRKATPTKAATTKTPTRAAAPRSEKEMTPQARVELTREELQKLIEEAAYYRAKQRGFEPGHELEDWIQAEAEVMRRLGVHDSLSGRLVQGENIAQTHQFVSTGNAELGFVALAQVSRDGRLVGGSGWIVPAELHAPIRQDMLVLARARANPAAAALHRYLGQPAATAVIRSFGYALP